MKILVAEDDEIFRALSTEILTDAGYEVTAKENGLLAWEYLQAGNHADMCVLDVNMPEMDGFELARRIRESENLKHLPILMLTVKAFAEDQLEGYESGVDDYLTKPFDRDVFLARLKVLERRILNKG